MFKEVNHIIIPSRHNMLPKGNKPARPRMHILFPVQVYSDGEVYASVKNSIQKKYPILDDNAVDAARFFFGSPCESEDIIWNEGSCNIDEYLSFETKEAPPMYYGSSIPEGSRNNTLSHFAGRLLKKLGITEEAREQFLARASQCKPPLSDEELNTIWLSAIKFARKVQSQDGYIPPEEYNNDFGKPMGMKPEDYSDIGEAKVLAVNCNNVLKFTRATDYIAFGGTCWYEDKEKSLGIIEDFMDKQLEDAETAIQSAEQDLIDIGVPKAEVKSRSRAIEKSIPPEKLGLLFALIAADTYKKFVMKYRNYKNIVNAQNAAKPMLAIDVSELDYDPELLNTPNATYDLTKGLDGGRPHDPDDLITKITACSPGTEGMQLWLDTLNLFFCNDQDLIDYVQQIVGLAAVGKVYAEHLIIAYGGGANGKSTFWNTIARVLGNYSGKLSAEALTMNCKRNVKPEVAELKGKRLIIASELEEGTRLNTGLVKQLCSIDPIEAEKKYKDPFHFVPSHTIVLYTNYLPKVSANDDGTWRRLIVIPFNAKITGKSDIKNYAEYLYEHAGSAILSWIIEGARLAIEKKFKIPEPKVVIDAIDAYREDNDWLGNFISEYCDVDVSFEEKSGELYQCYRSVCMQTGEYIRSTTDFYNSLEKAGYHKRRKTEGRMICGLKLKEGQDFLV